MDVGYKKYATKRRMNDSTKAQKRKLLQVVFQFGQESEHGHQATFLLPPHLAVQIISRGGPEQELRKENTPDSNEGSSRNRALTPSKSRPVRLVSQKERHVSAREGADGAPGHSTDCRTTAE